LNVPPDFPTHYKTRMLCELLADASAPLYVLRLWCECENRKSYRLDDLSKEALKALCGSPGPANKLQSSLVTSGFIRVEDKTLIVQSFADNNPELAEAWDKEAKKKCKDKKVSPYSAAFEEWWIAYPKQIAKEKANKAYVSAGKRLRDRCGWDSVATKAFLLEKALLYAKSPQGQSEFCPHPASWLNAGSYDDDPKDWQRDRDKPKAKSKQAVLPSLEEIGGFDGE
jgi:hypothetical protein